jgi:hypothetical protein
MPLPVDSLHVVRPHSFLGAGVSFARSQWTIRDGTKAQHVYNALLALPTISPFASFSCPLVIGPTYQLTFGYNGLQVLVATVDDNGCEFADLGVRGMREANDAFWSVFAQALGVPPAEVTPCAALPFCGSGETPGWNSLPPLRASIPVLRL